MTQADPLQHPESQVPPGPGGDAGPTAGGTHPGLTPGPKGSVFDRTDPGLSPVPVLLQSPQVAPDGNPWEEGTAAEWNPRWSTPTMQIRPGMAPEADFQPEGRRPVPQSRSGSWMLLGGALLLLGTGAGYLLLARTRPAPTPSIHPPRVVPPALAPYLRAAETGDVAAMRMLGLRYCYGLGTPPDFPEGVRWLRKAARAGSTAARQELAAMGAAQD
jgi:hypothetical protein